MTFSGDGARRARCFLESPVHGVTRGIQTLRKMCPQPDRPADQTRTRNAEPLADHLRFILDSLPGKPHTDIVQDPSHLPLVLHASKTALLSLSLPFARGRKGQGRVVQPCSVLQQSHLALRAHTPVQAPILRPILYRRHVAFALNPRADDESRSGRSLDRRIRSLVRLERVGKSEWETWDDLGGDRRRRAARTTAPRSEGHGSRGCWR